MEPDLRKMVEQTLTLEEENNSMLHKLVRVQRWTTFFWVLKWLVLLGITFGTYYYFQPALDKMWATYQQVSQTLDGTKTVSASLPDVNHLFDFFKSASSTIAN